MWKLKQLIWCSLAAGLGSRAAAGAGGGIVYVCDPSVTAASAGACNTLNTTTAGLYSAAFTNANATIYVTLGNAGLANSLSSYSSFSYTDFRNQLATSAAGGNDATAMAGSVPVANPFGIGMIDVNNALQRALGLNFPTFGVDRNMGGCSTLGSNGCYDGVITVSNVQPLYFRIGSIAPNQFDFYTLVEHETDEILGTASCAFGDCGGDYAPADLFRYHSNGSRSNAPGSNDPCSATDATNACFSIDGVHMLHQYNNQNNGLDAGDWVTNCAAQLVQDAQRCAGVAGVDISPNCRDPGAGCGGIHATETARVIGTVRVHQHYPAFDHFDRLGQCVRRVFVFRLGIMVGDQRY